MAPGKRAWPIGAVDQVTGFPMKSLTLALPLLLVATAARAQEEAPAPAAPESLQAASDAPAGPPSASDLAQQLSNPVSSLISVPLQTNFDCCYGPADGGRFTLNIQPVIPVSIGKDWNMIVRTIVPIISQEETVPGQGSASGFGDTVQSFFFSPKVPHNGLVWAVGPVFLYPTGGSDLGSKKWGAGPTALILKQNKSGLTVGMLANHLWSIAGEADRPNFSNTFLQPFIAKALPDSTTFSLNTEATYDWKNDHWTVPINLGVSHIFHFGKQLVQIGPVARYYVASPSGGPEWGARVVFTFLFPKR